MRQRRNLRCEIGRRLKAAFDNVLLRTEPCDPNERPAEFSVKEVIVGNQAQQPDAGDLVVRLDEVDAIGEQAQAYDGSVKLVAQLTLDYIVGNVVRNQDDLIDAAMQAAHDALTRDRTLGGAADFVRYVGYEVIAAENGQMVAGRTTYNIGYPSRV